MTEESRLEALRDLVQSHGWSIFRQMVMDDVTERFEADITKALDVSDNTIALDRMRQVAAVRLAGLKWLAKPKEEIDRLTNHARDSDEANRQGRRPRGL